MPASSSNLSSFEYGYDFVVATTQSSINRTMLNFLASRQEPTVNACFIEDERGPQAISYDDLKVRANGSDPFAIPDGSDIKTNGDLQNLKEARFTMGFRATLGVPPMDDPTKIPDIVTLGADTSAVKLNLLTSDFVVVNLDHGSGYSPPSWMKTSQPRNDPWIFTSLVDLRLSTMGDSAFSSLPATIQAHIKNLSGSAFSVQQLLFDLTNARVHHIPTIGGITPGSTLYYTMQSVFPGAYLNQMQKGGQPLLGCSIVQQTASAATLQLTNMDVEVSPFVDGDGQPVFRPTPDEAKLATLNYFCAADGARLPPPVKFSWNWIDSTDHDGVLSINRDTFAKYFRKAFDSYVPSVCFRPSVHVYEQDGGLGGTNFEWDLQPGQSPNSVTTPITGSTVLNYHYSASSSEQAGRNGDMGKLTLSPSFDLTVDFAGNTIVVKQHLVVWLSAKKEATDNSSNIVDKTITDTYTIAVNDQGQLEAQQSAPAIVDNGGFVLTDWFENFFTDSNLLTVRIKKSADAMVGTRFQTMPLNTVTSYVFPGGQTFIFKDVAFSDNQDLTATISYADPSRPVATVSASVSGS